MPERESSICYLSVVVTGDDGACEGVFVCLRMVARRSPKKEMSANNLFYLVVMG